MPAVVLHAVVESPHLLLLDVDLLRPLDHLDRSSLSSKYDTIYSRRARVRFPRHPNIISMTGLHYLDLHVLLLDPLLCLGRLQLVGQLSLSFLNIGNS